MIFYCLGSKKFAHTLMFRKTISIRFIANLLKSCLKFHKYKRIYSSVFFKVGKIFYATRWEKNDASGYMPVYKVDGKAYNKHKAQGGNFKNFKEKEHTPFLKPQKPRRFLYEALNAVRTGVNSIIFILILEYLK